MSQRTRLTEQPRVWPTISNVSSQQKVGEQKRMAESASLWNPRNSMTSVTSSGRRSTSSVDTSSRNGLSRPSGIPQPTSKTSQAKLAALASSRPGPTQAARYKTSPTISSVTASNRHRTILAINQDQDWEAQTRLRELEPFSTSNTRTASHRNYPVSTTDSDYHGVFGIPFPEKVTKSTTAELPPRLIPELRALAANIDHPRLVTKSASVISSPSTQFTNSPSPWSASTAATTPISWSSASPYAIPASKSPASTKRSQTVPIPSIARANLPRLPVLKENAFITTGTPTTGTLPVIVTPPRKTKAKTPAVSPAPTPPPRSSSIKRLRSRSNSKSDEQHLLDLHSMPPPLPTSLQYAQLADHEANHSQMSGAPFQNTDLFTHHHSLQDALNASRGPESVSTKSRISQTFTEASSGVDENPVSNGRLLEPATVEPPSRAQTSARSRLAKFSRMALFGRKSHGDTADPKPSSPSRKLQKGPVAGTGHEGYGRHVRRGRKSTSDGSTMATDSETSVVSVSRKPMRSSSRKDSSSRSRRDRQSQSDLDDFASSRLRPVVMRGGSHSVSATNQNSLGKAIHGITSGDDLVNEMAVSRAQDQKTPYTVPIIQNVGKISSESAKALNIETYQDGPQLSEFEETRVHQFDQNDLLTTSPSQPYTNAWSTSQSSLAPSSVAMLDIGNNLYKSGSDVQDHHRKASRKLRWNIFRKREDFQLPQPKVDSSRGVPQGMAVTISTHPQPRPLPYYAMLESESDSNTAEAIGEYLKEAATVTDMDVDEEFNNLNEGYSMQQPRRAESILLPSAPRYDPGIERSRGIGKHSISQMNEAEENRTPEPSPKVQTPRQPRLAQVGRIPKVVSAERFRQPNRTSFSRPFQQERTSENCHQTQTLQDIGNSQVLSVAETKPSRQLPRLETVGPSSFSSKSNRLEARLLQQPQLIDHSKTHDRQSITSSSSDGAVSVMGPPLLPSGELFRPEIRRTFMEEDIWNEYDDLLDHVVSPSTPTKLDDRDIKNDPSTKSATLSQRREITRTDAPSLRSLAHGLAIDTSLLPPPIIYASPELLQDSDADEIRLRRSRIVSALHSSLDPSSPFSIADYFREQGDIKRGSDRISNHLSTSTTSRGFPSPSLMPPLGSISTPVQRYDNVVHIDEVQRTRNPIKHSELAYTSLMVSRWLSFGRVLFSPAHVDVTNTPERHVLVIDGLGSDDWSIYCAVNYQSEHAYIYELKETGRSRVSSASRKSDHAPPNLRRREVRSFYDPFKFPDNFFSAIVLRFPPVMADSKMKNLISECRRVLAPGGYLELMLLDLDIVNMGVLTRRAMRNLKTKIAIADPGVSLKPVIDNFASVLGDKGFSKLSRCVVGVPVVGKPPGAADSPVSSRSSDGSDKPPLSSSAGPHPFDGIYDHANHNFSLNDLVADHSDNADAKISKMVSRTARNWWQHCFEAAVIVDGDLTTSILADRQVLKECKSRASSFKLLIAFTQKPFKPSIEAKRRTMSEPFIATLATA